MTPEPALEQRISEFEVHKPKSNIIQLPLKKEEYHNQAAHSLDLMMDVALGARTVPDDHLDTLHKWMQGTALYNPSRPHAETVSYVDQLHDGLEHAYALEGPQGEALVMRVSAHKRYGSLMSNNVGLEYTTTNAKDEPINETSFSILPLVAKLPFTDMKYGEVYDFLRKRASDKSNDVQILEDHEGRTLTIKDSYSYRNDNEQTDLPITITVQTHPDQQYVTTTLKIDVPRIK